MQRFTLLTGIWSVFYSTETLAQEHPNSETIRFVLAGDPTVTDEAGWGKGFAELCSENVECINLAASGRSSRSDRTEGRWPKCLDAKPDYLLIQFGHNDQAGKGPVAWLTRKDGDAKKSGDQSSPTAMREPIEFRNDHSSDRIKGNHEHACQVTLTGQMNGRAVIIAVLCPRDNFRAPPAARIHPIKPYFVFSPCVDDDFAIDREHPFQGKYRYLITNAAPDSKWLDE